MAHTATFGDLTGARYRASQEARKEHDQVIERTCAELRSGQDVTIIDIPGGRSHAVSGEVARYLRTQR